MPRCPRPPTSKTTPPRTAGSACPSSPEPPLPSEHAATGASASLVSRPRYSVAFSCRSGFLPPFACVPAPSQYRRHCAFRHFLRFRCKKCRFPQCCGGCCSAGCYSRGLPRTVADVAAAAPRCEADVRGNRLDDRLCPGRVQVPAPRQQAARRRGPAMGGSIRGRMILSFGAKIRAGRHSPT